MSNKPNKKVADFKRTIDDAALERLGKVSFDELQQAIAAGDKEQALKFATNMHSELKGMHDLFLLWVASLLSYIGKHSGDSSVLEAMEEMMKSAYPDADTPDIAFEDLTDIERLQTVAAGARGHDEAFTIEEKKDSYDLLIARCGGGGQLIQRGVYDGPDGLYKMQSPSKETYHQEDFAPYCTHCYFNGSLSPKGKSGKPIVEVIPAENPGHGTCICRIQKQDN